MRFPASKCHSRALLDLPCCSFIRPQWGDGREDFETTKKKKNIPSPFEACSAWSAAFASKLPSEALSR